MLTNNDISGPATLGVGDMPPPPLIFLRSKKKKGKPRKKEQFPKQKLLKGYHQGQNVTVLAILECLEFKKLITIITIASFLMRLHCPNHQEGLAQLPCNRKEIKLK